ncbi:hypothetical protein AMAG_18511 [Allomyces macrogynus ATCC 38327]|uniref:Uncharacterized protein n=1 Tax=Allomyces macrogynus (strain ATCC 38327) TaxID=578462 RepID=A0A0L0SD35_ALLM3|nr:hypothetical protein AMAG_18511 [Allomyces macrogynus ATCC 38327]|eukprot:KNE60310.1 hypothetical protein AMAG_18511 [Allomyces macrogynus ATCC 38327]
MTSTHRELSVLFHFTSSDGIALIFFRLPRTLEKLVVECWFRKDAVVRVHALARNMPPRLKTLTLRQCGLTAADLGVLDPVWPSILRYVDLLGHKCDRGPIGLLDGLLTLILQGNPLRGETALLASVRCEGKKPARVRSKM